MYCFHHTGTLATDRCRGCAELFCSDCLVEVGGVHYCDSCKCIAIDDPPVYHQAMGLSDEAKKAAGSAAFAMTIGLFACIIGLPLAIAAISFGAKGMRETREDPRKTGFGLALGSILIGILVIALSVVGVAMSQMK